MVKFINLFLPVNPISVSFIFFFIIFKQNQDKINLKTFIITFKV